MLKDLNLAIVIIMPSPANLNDPYFQSTKEASIVANKISDLSKFLSDKDYLLGHIILADFILVYIARSLEAITKVCEGDYIFAKHDNIKAQVYRFDS